MKKILSMAMLAVVALVASTLVSCSNDDNEGSGSSKKCSVQHYLTPDILSLFDVNDTRTAGTDIKKYSFTTATNFKLLDKTYSAYTNGEDVFSVKSGAKASVSVTLTLKDNWETILDGISGERAEMIVYKIIKTSITSNAEGTDRSVSKEKATKETLQKAGDSIARYLSEELVK